MRLPEERQYEVLIYKRESDPHRKCCVSEKREVKRFLREAGISKKELLDQFPLTEGNISLFLVALAALENAGNTTKFLGNLEEILLQTWEHAQQKH